MEPRAGAEAIGTGSGSVVTGARASEPMVGVATGVSGFGTGAGVGAAMVSEDVVGASGDWVSLGAEVTLAGSLSPKTS